MRTVYTIGHSTREIEEFIELLTEHSIIQLVDIRTIPKSRHNPQYKQAALEKSLKQNGIKYTYLKQLGGLRTVTKSSVNDAWRNKSFQNYADHMQSDEFQEGLDELMTLANNATTAIMCAEAVPWRCHRSLVGDALLVHDFKVEDIMSAKTTKPHALTSFAVVDGKKLTYPKSALKDA